MRGPSQRVGLGVLLLLMAALEPGMVSAASPSRVALVWRTPEESGCTAPDEIQRRVANLTDRRLNLDDARDQYRIVVELTPERDSWRAYVLLLDPNGSSLGTRELHGRLPDCQALDVPVVLVIATLLDDLREQELKRERAAADGGWYDILHSAGLGASLTGAIGFAPSPWLGITLLATLPVSRTPLLLDASAYWPHDELDAAGRGVRAGGFHTGASMCPHLVLQGPFDVQLCTGAELGAVWATGIGLTASGTSMQPRLLLGLEPKLLLKLAKSLALQLSLSGSWVPLRHPFKWMINDELRTLEGESFVFIVRIGLISFLF